jgi:ribonuclease G
MAKNLLVISVEAKETRVALIENGIIAELHIERSGNADAGSVGNIILGKVTRVLPGLQAAFVDIGQERAAFLHVEDLIRPDDFDAYLAGGRRHAKDDTAADTPDVTGDEELDVEIDAELKAAAPLPGEPSPALVASPAPAEPATGNDEAAPPAPLTSTESPEAAQDGVDATAPADASGEAMPDDPDDLDLDDSTDDVDERASASALEDADEREDDGPSDADLGDEGDTSEGALDGPDSEREPAVSPSDPPAALEGAASAEPGATEPVPAPASVAAAPRAAGPAPARAFGEEFDDLPGFTVSDPGDPTPRAPARPRVAGHRDDRRREHSGGRRRGRGGARGREGAGREGGSREGGSREGGSRDDRRGPGREGRSRPSDGGIPGRLSKTTPIRDVVREGQEIIVQVSKDPIGTKGARCTSHISLPGRYVVYLPTVDHVGVSKRIGSDKERGRLRETIESMKPPTGGLIVRTVAEGLTKKQLKTDVGYLVRLWGEVAKKREGAKAPTLLSSELDLVLKTARDLFTDEVEQIVIDDRRQYDRLCHFVEMFMPERMKDVIHYGDEEPIFDAYGIEDEIARALSRKVPLPSGGHLVIDQAEALTAIDVNTGRFVGKGSKDMEETILKTNLEAVHEIAYQLRFRNIGGLIILDLIDMDRHGNREKVRRTLEELLQKDKAKTTLNRISDLGLIEMTRKRTRESLGRLMHEPCFYCDGTGQLQSKETIAYEILREIRRRRADLPGYTIVVHAHPAVADILQTSEHDAVMDAENRYMRKITVIPRTEYHLEQFDLAGK